MKYRYKKNSGFTLAELIMAMWVVSIILTAVATLSFALGSANDSAEDTSELQSRIRFTAMKLTDIIKNSSLICANRGDRIAIWKGDENSDGKLNPAELMYIESGGGNDSIQILEFDCPAWMNWFRVPLSKINDGSLRSWLSNRVGFEYTTLIDNCSYVVISTDVGPPYTNLVNISFGIENDSSGVIDEYKISAAIRCRADCLLDETGELVNDDDDM